MAALSVASLIGGVLPVLGALAVGWAVGGLVAGAALGHVVGAAAVVGLAGLAGVLVQLTRGHLGAELNRRVERRAKDRLYSHVNEITHLAPFEDPAFRDRLRLAEQGSRTGPGQLIEGVLGALAAVITLTGLVTLVAGSSIVAAVVLAAGAVPLLLSELRLSRQRAAMMLAISPAERREFFFTDLLTTLEAAKELRLFGSAKHLHHRMLTELGSVHRAQRAFDRREWVVQAGLATLSAGLTTAALVIVFANAGSGLVDAGSAAGVVFAVAGLIATVTALVSTVGDIRYASMLFDHYLEIVAEPTARPGGRALQSAPVEPGVLAHPNQPGIVFEDVWFRYGPDLPWVLQGVSLTLGDRETLALVGENGSGKSTVVKLICRFYDPERGRITWNGVDLRDLDPVGLRLQISAVFQDFMSYELTVAENLGIGTADGRAELDLDPEHHREPLAAAGLTDMVDGLPAGTQTLLSRSFADPNDLPGVLLSGGQWQRIAVARALFRGPRELLILDEPSSGLDPNAEYELQHSLSAMSGRRAVLLISHRLNTVRDAHRILVLSSGVVTEEGSHQELIARGGTYAQLFSRQAEGFQSALSEPG